MPKLNEPILLQAAIIDDSLIFPIAILKIPGSGLLQYCWLLSTLQVVVKRTVLLVVVKHSLLLSVGAYNSRQQENRCLIKK